MEYDYDALGRKVFRASASYDLNYLKSNVNNGNGNGRWSAINNGNGKKVGLYKQLQGALTSDTTYFMYDGLTSDVMKEYGPEGQPFREYYWANGEVNASKMFGFHGKKETSWEGNVRTRGGLLYYSYDATGNVLGVDDRVGDTVFNYRYDAFGNLFTDMPAPYNATGCTGKNYDPEAGLMDYSARWYSPNMGRFLTEDTYLGDLANTQSLNRYAYVMNNPINMVDPTGHVPEWVRDREDYSDQFIEDGKTYAEFWNYLEGSYRITTSPTILYDTIQTSKHYQLIYRNTITESWKYDYSRYFIDESNADKPIHLAPYDDTLTYKETQINEWDEIITAKEIMNRNAATIASFGAPPNARVVYRSSSVSGKSFSYEIVYNGETKFSQVKLLKYQIAGFTGGSVQTGSVQKESYLESIYTGIKKGIVGTTDFLVEFITNPFKTFNNVDRDAQNFVNRVHNEFETGNSYSQVELVTEIITSGALLKSVEGKGTGSKSGGNKINTPIEVKAPAEVIEVGAKGTDIVGGAYKNTPANGGQVHHMPANSVSPYSKGDGPGIRMETVDHMKTKSWGSSKKAKEYRTQQKELIEQGKFREAQQMDIYDVRSQFGNKYDKGIEQLLKYTKDLLGD